VSLESDTQAELKGKLDFSSSPAGEAHDAKEEPESLPAVRGSESPASTDRLMEEVRESRKSHREHAADLIKVTQIIARHDSEISMEPVCENRS
jgi:hypothetical protein